MSTFQTKAADFLAQKRFAVAGVSRSKNGTANVIYRALRDRGYEVFPVNPAVEVIEGEVSYPSVSAVPGGVDGAVIVTRPESSEQIVRDCVDCGVPRVWMHHNAMMGAGYSSISPEGVEYARKHGLTVIDGGCPMMFLDIGHKCMRWILGLVGRLPR